VPGIAGRRSGAAASLAGACRAAGGPWLAWGRRGLQGAGVVDHVLDDFQGPFGQAGAGQHDLAEPVVLEGEQQFGREAAAPGFRVVEEVGGGDSEEPRLVLFV
jgi:hypothetical protein